MNETDLEDLRQAKEALDNPGLVAKISNVIGTPLEIALNRLPAGWKNSIHSATEKSLRAALDVALRTFPESSDARPQNALHKIAVGTTGAIGGAFGLASLALELPLSTTIILRSIMDIARSEGEDIASIETKMACLTVFALGGTSDLDNAAESGYFAARAALSRAIGETTAHLAKKGLAEGSAPALVRLIAAIGSRFEVTVAEKAAAQIVPLIGATGGATINVLFIDHFQTMARGHFVMRRLERKYGEAAVKKTYLTIGTSPQRR